MTRTILQRHRDLLLAAVLFLATLAVYLRTLCPTLYWGDCGELGTVAYRLGIPHAPGQPLWCLLAKAWALLVPVGTIIWRLNTLSAVLGALAVVALFAFSRTIRLPRALALTVAGMFAFSYTFWQQCLVTETYSLSALYTCLLLFLAARWRARGCRAGDLRLLAVAYGFAGTGHQINTLFLPGFIAFILWSQPALLGLRDPAVRRQWVTSIGPGLLPLLFYAYLPLRARMHPTYNWGDPETPFAFFYEVTGRIFAPLMFHQKIGDVLTRLTAWAVDLRVEYPWPLVALAALGLACLWRRPEDRPLALLLTWMLLADVTYTVNYAIYNGYIYYIPGYVVLSILAGHALRRLWQSGEPQIRPANRPAVAALGTAALLLAVPMQIAGHRHVDLSRNWTCYDYGRNLLATVPPHGILIENGDDTASSAIYYLQQVEGYRTDVTLVRRGLLSGVFDPQFGRWANAWYLDQLQRAYPPSRTLYPHNTITATQAMQEDILRRLIAQAVAAGRPTFVLAPQGEPVNIAETPPFWDDDGTPVRLDAYLARHYETAQIGLLMRVYPRGGRPSDAALLAETRRVWDAYTLRGVHEGALQTDNYLVLLALGYAHADMARANLAAGQGQWADAARSYRNVLTLFDSPEASTGLARCAAHARTASR